MPHLSEPLERTDILATRIAPCAGLGVVVESAKLMTSNAHIRNEWYAIHRCLSTIVLSGNPELYGLFSGKYCYRLAVSGQFKVEDFPRLKVRTRAFYSNSTVAFYLGVAATLASFCSMFV